MFQKEEKNLNLFFFILSADSKYYLFSSKKCLRFRLCIFESDTVKSDCPVQSFKKKMMKYSKIKYRLFVYPTSFTIFSGDIK